MDRFTQLNEKFYSLYGDLHENKTFLSERQFKYMQAKLFEQYEIEFEKLFLDKITYDKFQIFNLKRRKAKKVPKTFLFFKNKLSKILIKLISEEVKAYYRDIEQRRINI